MAEPQVSAGASNVDSALEAHFEEDVSGSDFVDSLPSTSVTSSSISSIGDEDEQGESDAEREWRESIQQLELILTMVLVPYIGKYFGRKAAYWGM